METGLKPHCPYCCHHCQQELDLPSTQAQMLGLQQRQRRIDALQDQLDILLERKKHEQEQKQKLKKRVNFK